MSQFELTIGSDPEFFVEQDGRIVSCHTAKVKGRKGRPFQLEVGAMHRDNVLVELNVPPSFSEEEFVSNHTACLNQAMDMIPDFKVSRLASVHMPAEELYHVEAMVFGCEPDYNAWLNGEVNPPPVAEGTHRTAGGHVHIGYKNPTEDRTMNIIRSCDLYLGIPSVLMDEDTERRALYGQAGAFRFKSYGGEYRVLSNFWLMDQDLTAWVYRNTKRAVQAAFTREMTDQRVIDVINTSNKEAALELVQEYNLEVL